MTGKSELFPLVEVIRNNQVESFHVGSAVIVDCQGSTIQEWGDSARLIFPRSSIKMIQALPLIESGALDRFGLGKVEVALACASHQGSTQHTDKIKDWLSRIAMNENNLLCGVQPPSSSEARQILRSSGKDPSQLNNNCSGKHAGFLTVSKHLKFSLEYTDVCHPLQKDIRNILADLSEEQIDTYGVDGCSAPNFMCSIKGLAFAMAKFSYPKKLGRVRSKAIALAIDSMFSYPYLVAGDKRACTDLMRASESPIIVKTGAEGVFVAAVPKKKLGIALKIFDGSARASEAAITAILVRLGVLDKEHPLVKKRLFRPVRNWNGFQTGIVAPSSNFWANGAKIK